jgi:hypothetical protein
MMEEDFYASLKLISGEEIFAKVITSEEYGNLVLLVSDPIVITEVKTRYGFAYKVEPWMKTTKDDIFIIDMKNIMTMTETNDIEIISIYDKFVKQKEKDDLNFGVNYFELTKEMGYISTIEEAKKSLENLFKNH